jgi:probable rRNA maturation factor
MTNPAHAYAIDVQIDEAYATGADAEDLVRAIEETLRQANVVTAGLTVALTDDETVRALNQQYRGIDAPTDVLSFASNDAETPGAGQFVLPPELAAEMAAYLGDIVIAYPYAVRQAARFGNSVGAELRLLAVHGALHLLGYDHDTAQAEAEMWAIQNAVLAACGDPNVSQRSYDA